MGNEYAKLFISNLLKKKEKEIVKLKKGWYTFKKRSVSCLLANLLVKGYVGLGSAALIHGVWDKAVNTAILTPLAGRKIRAGERFINNEKVIIKRISEKMYFGYELKTFDDMNVRVSTPEKTLIDMLYFDYFFLDEIAENLIEICEKRKLFKYLEILKKRGVKKHKKIKEEILTLIR